MVRDGLKLHPKLNPEKVMLPDVTRERSAITEINVPGADSKAYPRNGVDNGIAGGGPDHGAFRHRHHFLAIRYRPADDFDHRGRKVQTAKADPDAITCNIAGEIGTGH